MSILIERRVAPARGEQHRCWVPDMPGEAKALMYCFHPAGGAASLYRGWSAKCPGGFATSALQLPGRETRMREAPHRTMKAAVAEIVDGLADMPNRPFCFFGFSLGGCVALATIRELQRRGRPLPNRLIIAASPSPFGKRKPVNEMSDDSIIEEIRLSGTVPEFILREREVMRTMVPTIRADLELLESFRSVDEAPLSVPIVAYAGLSDPLVDASEVASWC